MARAASSPRGLKLLLDEHYSPQIAARLRERGHDAISVKERADLIEVPDDDLLSLMARERRVIVTENWGDFRRAMLRATESGALHSGVLFTSRKRLPRSRNTIGLYVEVLDEFLRRHPHDDALQNTHRWLPETPL